MLAQLAWLVLLSVLALLALFVSLASLVVRALPAFCSPHALVTRLREGAAAVQELGGVAEAPVAHQVGSAMFAR